MAIRGTTILFTAAGRRVSLIRQFRAALRRLGDPGLCLTADASATAPAHQVGDRAHAIPRCTSPDYVEVLLDLCRTHGVRLLVPLIDTELPLLAAARARFAAIGTTVLVSEPATIAIANDKYATERFFRAAGLATPRCYLADQARVLPESAFPLFVKPVGGSASIGARKVATPAALDAALADTPGLLIQDYVSGHEHTVDIWVDPVGQPRCVVPRRRLEVRAGEVSKGVTVRHPGIIAAATAAATALPGARGLITLQGFLQPDQSFMLIEINARFGGGAPLSVHAGADFPLWAIQEVRDEQPDYAAGQAFRHGLMMLRYDDELIVDAAQLPWSIKD